MHHRTAIDKVFSRSQVPLTLADARDESFALLEVNDPFCAMTGYTRAEFLGKNCRFLQGDDREQVARFEMRDALKAQKDIQVIFRNYNRWGEPFDSLVFINHIRDIHNNILYVLGSQFMIKQRDYVERLNDHLSALDESYAMLARSQQAVELNVRRQISESTSVMLHSEMIQERLSAWNRG